MLVFENILQDIEKLKLPLQEVEEALHLDQALIRIEELEMRSAQADFWSDPQKAQTLQKEMTHLKQKVNSFSALKHELDEIELLTSLGNEEEDETVLPEIQQKMSHWRKQFESLRLETYFTDPLDENDAILTLHAGVGGTEACDWTEMLFRMYTRWAEQHDYSVEVLDSLDGEDAGLKSVCFRVSGENAYGMLKNEMGVHRLVRISPFDATGRRHTSFASLEVLPQLDQTIEIEIRPEDVRIDYYRSSGAGGQHINKTSSAVRMTHIPTNIVVTCQNERSQIQNRETATAMLKAKLYTLARRAQLDRIEDLKGDQSEIGWGSQIRSYVFCPYTLVKDNRTGVETADISGVMDGDLDLFIKAMLSQKALK